jgi:hypothetical protein
VPIHVFRRDKPKFVASVVFVVDVFVIFCWTICDAPISHFLELDVVSSRRAPSLAPWFPL